MTSEDGPSPTWPAEATHRIGRNIKKARKRRGMTVEALAKVCSKLGVPMGRTSITNLEIGRRHSITLADLVAFAWALDVPPIALIYPPDDAGAEIDVVKDTTARTFDALMWFTGEAHHGASDGDAAPDQDYSLLRNLRSIRAAEATARHYLRQGTNAGLRQQMEEHAVLTILGVLPYRDACDQLLAHPLPIPEDLAMLYARAEAQRSNAPGVL